MATLLSALGHRVTVAMTVAEALDAAAREEPIDIVVSDLGLPDGSGHDLMRELAGRYGLRGIALSGYGMEADIQKSHEAGFEKHLTKPIDIALLRSVIRQVARAER
jgi:CheY-like chemotaxis protein